MKKMPLLIEGFYFKIDVSDLAVWAHIKSSIKGQQWRAASLQTGWRATRFTTSSDIFQEADKQIYI